jgi:hypothetical protein
MQTRLLTTMFDIGSYLRDYSFQESRDLFSYSTTENRTRIESVQINGHKVTRFINEFWTAKQRQAAPLHEIAYRACFKPQLPRFFIGLLTSPQDIAYDPFSGRGTTMIEAALLGRNVIANDINPISQILSLPRLFIPRLDALEKRLASIRIDENARAEIDLAMFYHPKTLREITSLRQYLLERSASGTEDHLDEWIRMVATNRLTGHSSGFFSVYTLPPNQAVSPESQRKINEKRRQIPPYRDTQALILRKSRQLIKGLTAQEIKNLANAGEHARFLNCDARCTSEIEGESVQLTVTSPPFLDIVQYAQDNWLRCWFNGINEKEFAKKITTAKSVDEWSSVMQAVFNELYRITRRGGWVAFEVGEVRKGEIKLDEHVVPLGAQAGFDCQGILVNQQEFTKTANIWGIRNNEAGTNTNRIVMFFKP